MKKFFSNKVNVILSVLLLIVLSAVGFLGFTLLKGKPVQAIDFSQLTASEIEAWAKDKEISDKLEIVYEYDNEVPEGKVVYQSVKEGDDIVDVIRVTVSKGIDPNYETELPDISAQPMKMEEVEVWLKEHNFSNYTFSYELSDSVEEDTVLGFEPSGKANPNQELTVKVSAGKNNQKVSVQVPDFTGKTKSDVDAWAKAGSIKVKYSYKESSSVKEGNVIDQDKPYGTVLHANDTISITISKEAPKGIQVPDSYLGYAEADFIKAIEKLGLKAAKQEKFYYSSTYARGTVYAYDSSSDGIIFNEGDTVKYYLCAGVKDDTQIIVEDSYLGYKEADFIKAIEKLGLVPKKQSKTYKSSKYVAGSVYAYDSSSDGIVFHKGDEVKYYLVEGAVSDVVTVPDSYLGYKEADFVAAIEKLGLKAVKQSEHFDSQKYAPGTVYKYDSSSDGIVFHKGDSVKYYLVKGSGEQERVNVPDTYIGLTEADFIKAIEKLNLVPKKAYTKTDCSEKYQGKVYEYDSSSDGNLFHTGDTVNYKVCTLGAGSSNPTGTSSTSVSVPDLKNKTRNEVENWAKENNIKVTYSEKNSDTVANGKVISNSNAGESVKSGSTISVVLSKGPEAKEETAYIGSYEDYESALNASTTYDNSKSIILSRLSKFSKVNVSGKKCSGADYVGLGQLVSIKVNGSSDYDVNKAYPVSSTTIDVVICNEN